jgi:flagellar basal-body rod modification protein FlgD
MQTTVLDASSYRVIDPYEQELPPDKTELGRNDFMRLLLTQLRNQNPLDPTKDTEFIAELAQFSSLEQLIQVNDGLGRVESGQQSLINAQALDLIGRAVLVDSGGTLRLRDGQSDEIVYALAEPAARARLEVSGADGRILRTQELEGIVPGRWSVRWDGKDDKGNLLPDDDYTYRILAEQTDGTPVETASFLSLSVDGVNFASGGLTLVSRDREIPFLNIIEIRTDGEPSS